MYITPLQKRRKLIDKGYDFQPVKQSNNTYTVNVWHYDKLKKEGVKEFKCYHKAIKIVESMYYEYLKL